MFQLEGGSCIHVSFVNYFQSMKYCCRIFFAVEDSIEIAKLFRIHGGNAQKIIEKLHDKHRMTKLDAFDKKDQTKIKDHIKNLLRPNHSIWDEKIPDFNISKKQQITLDKIGDEVQKNLLLAKMEREFKAPKELEQVTKNQLRKELQSIISDEEKLSTRDEMCASELNFKIFQKSDERSQIRMEAQAQQLKRMRNENSMNDLAIQFANTQKILLNCLSLLTPQLSISMGLQNLEKISTMTDRFDSLSLPAAMEEVLDNLRVGLVDSLRECASKLSPEDEEPQRKKSKIELSDDSRTFICLFFSLYY